MQRSLHSIRKSPVACQRVANRASFNYKVAKTISWNGWVGFGGGLWGWSGNSRLVRAGCMLMVIRPSSLNYAAFANSRSQFPPKYYCMPRQTVQNTYVHIYNFKNISVCQFFLINLYVSHRMFAIHVVYCEMRCS